MKMNRKNLILYLYILFFTFLVLTSCANAPEYYYQGDAPEQETKAPEAKKDGSLFGEDL